MTNTKNLPGLVYSDLWKYRWLTLHGTSHHEDGLWGIWQQKRRGARFHMLLGDSPLATGALHLAKVKTWPGNTMYGLG